MKKGEWLSKAEKKLAAELVQEWRSRLTGLDWLMRCLNEFLARQANAEDHCTGRFWEGRYKSQALLDEQALLTCMSYVDLNPIRASINPTPEASDYTSIQKRIRTHQASVSAERDQAQSQTPQTPVRLVDFIGNERNNQPEVIAFSFPDCLELVDWTGLAGQSVMTKPGLFLIVCLPFYPDWGLSSRAGWIRSITTNNGFSGLWAQWTNSGSLPTDWVNAG